LDFLSFYQLEGLGNTDAAVVASVFKMFLKNLGFSYCWSVKDLNHAAFKHFTTSSPSCTRYKGRDARLLFLALVDQFPPLQTVQVPGGGTVVVPEGTVIEGPEGVAIAPKGNTVLVRKSVCRSRHCLNPSHYYFGTATDVALERNQKKGSKLTTKLMDEIKNLHQQDNKKWNYSALAKQYQLPYYTVRRLCVGATYNA
jgi:hypothetical protein